MTKAGLANSEGCSVIGPDVDPAVGALDLRPEEQGQHHEPQRAEEDEKSGAARQPDGEEGQRHECRHREDEIEELALDEVEGVSTDALRHRRACRHGDEHAGGHEEEHGEHQSAVHREPPLGEKAAVATSEQHGHLLELSFPHREAWRRP